MRITAEAKAATRRRILDAAQRLFCQKGFEQATTRDIAREVGVATGTMFNYFPSKEAIVVDLASAAIQKAERDFVKNQRPGAPLEEDLFLHVATQLRHLRSVRAYIKPLLDTAFSPSAAPRAGDSGVLLRADLTEQFAGILAHHGIDEPSAIAMNMFWALYVGVLTVWGHDKSPKQEDTLALLDQSTQMFASWLK